MARQTNSGSYRVAPFLIAFGWLASSGILLAAEPSTEAPAAEANLTDDQLLELVQRQTFRYFYDFGHPDCGLARERSAPALRGNQRSRWS